MAFIQFIPVVQSQDAINRELYRRADLVNEYSKIELHPPEAVALVRYRDDIQSRRVLDLGCGAGRLAMYLRPLTKQYVGVDVSEHMVAFCAEHFPELPFQRADMRQLPFATGVFDTVFSLFNLMDAVSHEARLHCLGEIQRVLKPGGLLVFSSHNRRWKMAGAGPTLELRLNPLSQLRALARYLRSYANHRRLIPSQREETDYALCNDDAHEFALLHYYITRDAQTRQFREAGFQLLECLDENGQTLHLDDDDSTYSSLHYIARSIGPR
jgi:SAM-dependent methyltransferase